MAEMARTLTMLIITITALMLMQCIGTSATNACLDKRHCITKSTIKICRSPSFKTLPDCILTGPIQRLYIVLSPVRRITNSSLAGSVNLTEFTLLLNQRLEVVEQGAFNLPKIRKISLNNDLQPSDPIYLHEATFNNCPELRELALTNLYMAKVHPALFSRNRLLAKITLDLTPLRLLPSTLFANNHNLTDITLRSLLITQLDSALFWNNTGLRKVTLANLSKLSEIPPSLFANNQNLQQVTLANLSKLSEIPPSLFANNQNLQQVTLAGLLLLNALNPVLFHHNSRLTHLVLAKLMIHQIPNSLFRNKTDLHDVTFEELPRIAALNATLFQHNANLSSLNLNRLFNLSEIPSNLFANNTNLHQVSFGDLPISSLNATLFKKNRRLSVINLVRLYKLSEIPSNLFANNTNLQQVNLNNLGGLSEIPSSLFVNNMNLQQVSFVLLPVRALNASLLKYNRRLSVIFLVGLKVKELPPDLFSSNHGLRNITFSTFPMLTRLPSLSHLHNIRYLQLHRLDNLSAIPANLLYNFTSLTELALLFNPRLSQLPPKLLVNNRRLSILRVRTSGALTELPSNLLQNNHRLKLMDIDTNIRLPPGFFEPVNSIQTLTLYELGSTLKARQINAQSLCAYSSAIRNSSVSRDLKYFSSYSPAWLTSNRSLVRCYAGANNFQQLFFCPPGQTYLVTCYNNTNGREVAANCHMGKFVLTCSCPSGYQENRTGICATPTMPTTTPTTTPTTEPTTTPTATPTTTRATKATTTPATAPTSAETSTPTAGATRGIPTTFISATYTTKSPESAQPGSLSVPYIVGICVVVLSLLAIPAILICKRRKAVQQFRTRKSTVASIHGNKVTFSSLGWGEEQRRGSSDSNASGQVERPSSWIATYGNMSTNSNSAMSTEKLCADGGENDVITPSQTSPHLMGESMLSSEEFLGSYPDAYLLDYSTSATATEAPEAWEKFQGQVDDHSEKVFDDSDPNTYNSWKRPMSKRWLNRQTSKKGLVVDSTGVERTFNSSMRGAYSYSTDKEVTNEEQQAIEGHFGVAAAHALASAGKDARTAPARETVTAVQYTTGQQGAAVVFVGSIDGMVADDEEYASTEMINPMVAAKSYDNQVQESLDSGEESQTTSQPGSHQYSQVHGKKNQAPEAEGLQSEVCDDNDWIQDEMPVEAGSRPSDQPGSIYSPVVKVGSAGAAPTQHDNEHMADDESYISIRPVNHSGYSVGRQTRLAHLCQQRQDSHSAQAIQRRLAGFDAQNDPVSRERTKTIGENDYVPFAKASGSANRVQYADLRQSDFDGHVGDHAYAVKAPLSSPQTSLSTKTLLDKSNSLLG